jgi:hypothetical protein
MGIFPAFNGDASETGIFNMRHHRALQRLGTA